MVVSYLRGARPCGQSQAFLVGITL
uniref:Uncharacterized protein n=1 Tax=Arundo donax TaxID=35708 RepID=A0A0A9CQD1_ARUDO